MQQPKQVISGTGYTRICPSSLASRVAILVSQFVIFVTLIGRVSYTASPRLILTLCSNFLCSLLHENQASAHSTDVDQMSHLSEVVALHATVAALVVAFSLAVGCNTSLAGVSLAGVTLVIISSSTCKPLSARPLTEGTENGRAN